MRASVASSGSTMSATVASPRHADRRRGRRQAAFEAVGVLLRRGARQWSGAQDRPLLVDLDHAVALGPRALVAEPADDRELAVPLHGHPSSVLRSSITMPRSSNVLL